MQHDKMEKDSKLMVLDHIAKFMGEHVAAKARSMGHPQAVGVQGGPVHDARVKHADHSESLVASKLGKNMAGDVANGEQLPVNKKEAFQQKDYEDRSPAEEAQESPAEEAHESDPEDMHVQSMISKRFGRKMHK